MTAPLHLESIDGTPRLNAQAFFSCHAFFTTREFTEAYVASGHSASAVDDVLAHAVRSGRLARLRNGLYATRDAGWHPFELVPRLAHDAVLGYDGALAFHGLTGVDYGLTVSARRWSPPLVFNDVEYRVVSHPLPRGSEHLHTLEAVLASGTRLRVTTPARALVDCMARLELSPGFTETFLAFAKQPDFEVDLDEVVAYARRLRCRIAASRAGAILWGHPRWNKLNHHHQHRLAELGLRQVARAATPPKDEWTADPWANGQDYLPRFRLVVPGDFMMHVARLNGR